jgi:hypothetical protein
MLRRLARIWKIPVWMFWDLCSNPVWYSANAVRAQRIAPLWSTPVDQWWMDHDRSLLWWLCSKRFKWKKNQSQVTSFLPWSMAPRHPPCNPSGGVWECRWCGFSVGWKLQCRSAELTVPKTGPHEKIRYEMYPWNHQSWSGKLTKRKLA